MEISNGKASVTNPTPALSPMIEFLEQALVERILAEALEVLENVGVFVEHPEALALLGDAGASIDAAGKRARIKADMVWRCVWKVPANISIFGRDGKPAMNLSGRNVHFNPGSAALKILDPATGAARTAGTADLISLSRVAEALPNMDAQSTGLVPSDVPGEMADRFRLYLCLLNSRKPIVTGTFTTGGFEVMRELLIVAAGGEEQLREKPIAIFDACASQPLKWSRLTTQSLLDCARAGIPAELISVPLLGATAPCTLTGALVQHTAENLSGLVMHQIAGPGSPLIYGGSPAAFDMRFGTIALGAPESMMLCCAYAQIGRFLGLPTHGYLGLSDAKALDAQAGLESGMGTLMAALGGINVVSGPGMLDFENCQSLEKLVIDDQACAMARRILAGIQPREMKLAEDLFGALEEGDHFLISPVTMRWLREEVWFPAKVIDREPAETAAKGKGLWERAREAVVSILNRPESNPLPEATRKSLREIIVADGRKWGLPEERIP
jgi:trimethylamine---corrinoid protein Co-methyltransferase